MENFYSEVKMSFRIFNVGGSVRNELMSLPIKDNDYVVVGATPEDLTSKGFKIVGNDFPVFISPEGDEYALARKEVSTGSGYNDFSVEFGPDVTLEEDLFRRDFTVNSIAKDIETGEIIDPFGGVADIENRIFRMTNPMAFSEDPVRVLRLARFLAQYPSFTVSPETKKEAFATDISNCTAERVGAEMTKALMGSKPSNFFRFIREINQLNDWFPEVKNMISIPQTLKFHMEGDAFEHTMMVLDSSAKHSENVLVRFGALVHDFGKALTPKDVLPAHHGHEERGVMPVENFAKRLKLSSEMKRVGMKVAEFHGHVHKANELNPKTFVRIFEEMKSHLDDVDVVARVAFHDNEGKLPWSPYGDNETVFSKKVKASKGIKLSDFFTIEEIKEMSLEKKKNVIHQNRIKAVVNV